MWELGLYTESEDHKDIVLLLTVNGNKIKKISMARKCVLSHFS